MAKKLAFDKGLFTVIVVLIVLGLAMVYSASAAMAEPEFLGLNRFIVKQAAAAMLGFCLMLALMHTDYRHMRARWFVYGFTGLVAVLLVTTLFGAVINNTRRWLIVGGISLQPSELAKLAVVPLLAYLISKHETREQDRELLIPSLFFLGVLSALVLLGRDLGATLLVLLIGTVMLFLARVAWTHLVTGGLIAIPMVAFFIVSEPYRQKRMLAFLNPEADPLGTGFQALQSLIAIGSGGFVGAGLGAGLQKLHFLPYPHSDFIFAIVGEELGLLGAVGVVGLFALFLWRGFRAGSESPDTFGRFLAWGITTMVVGQALVHISVSLSLLPTTGITLPFLSYGGTSLVVTLIACGVLLNVSQHG